MIARADSFARPPRDEATASIGFAIFLGSWLMMFAGLFFSYGLIRSRMAFWPPVDLPAPPLALTGLATIVVAASSGLVHASLLLSRRQKRGTAALLLAAASLGAIFLALQFRTALEAHAQGLRVETGTYASILYAMAGTHAAHVVVGIAALVGLAVQRDKSNLRLWAAYWHSVGLVWLAIYLFVFVL